MTKGSAGRCGVNTGKYEAFLEIARCGNYTKTAEKLGYTQSAVSQMIRSLEEEFGSTLLIRKKGGMALTQEGRELLPLIEAVVGDCRRLENMAAAIRSIDSGRVSIALNSFLSSGFLPDLMADFSREYPNVRFTIRTEPAERAQLLAGNEEVDFAVLYGKRPASLMGLKLFDVELVAAGRADVLAGENGTVRLADLGNERILAIGTGDECGIVRSRASAQGITLTCANRADDMLTGLELIRSGFCISILAKRPGSGTALDLVRSGEEADCGIVCRGFDPPITSSVWLVLKDMNRISRTGKCFLDLIAETCFSGE
jgi:DNA-binding transcriptional LysR family regulator